jgi:hypothetical protein
MLMDLTFTGVLTKFYIVCIILINIYCLLKEREILGCTRISIKRQCNELNSVFFKGTLPDKNDSRQMLESKLYKILSMHDSSAVWRRGFIISTVFAIFIRLFTEITSVNLIAIHIIMVAILYFYHHFMKFHVYDLGKKIGAQLILQLRTK